MSDRELVDLICLHTDLIPMWATDKIDELVANVKDHNQELQPHERRLLMEIIGEDQDS